jgi:hypothetical protein
MSHEPPRRQRPKPAPPAPSGAGGDREDPETTSDRPTVSPPFDVEAFARASTAVRDPGGAPGHRWGPPAQQLPPETPTARPPPPDLSPPPRSEQITLTNEAELERAVAKSALSEPPRYNTPSALSIANARAPSVPNVPIARIPSPSNIEAAVLGAIGAAPEITERTIEDPIAEMRERFSLGDYTGALEMAELMLTEDPDDTAARECAESCRGVLESMYAARLGSLARVPSVIVQRTQLRWLSIDHRAGFVLSLIDGSSTLEMILDVCGMPKLDAMRILYELVQQKIVSLKG